MHQSILGLLVLAVALVVLQSPAWASFPADNGKIGYTQGGDIWTIKPDGTGTTNLTGSSASEPCAAWAPGGAKIAFVRGAPDSGLYVMSPDGTSPGELDTMPDSLGYEVFGCPDDWSPDATKVTYTVDDHCDAGGLYIAYLAGGDPLQLACGGPACNWDTAPISPDWSPDGAKIAVAGCQLTGEADIWTINVDQTGAQQVTNTVPVEECPDFSPDGSRIAYLETDFWGGTYTRVYVVNADGSGKVQLTTSGYAGCPRWSPEGSKIAFELGGDIWTVNPEGGSLDNLTGTAAQDLFPFWSPDAEKLLFRSNRDGSPDLYVMNRDGSTVTRVTNSSAVENPFGWQAIPKNYPRPKGASPSYFSLVPGYTPCTSSNRQHGPPLVFPSCNPPAPASPHLTIGSPDANGAVAQFTGHLLTSVLVGNPATPADEADATLEASTTDIRCTHTSPPTTCGADNWSTFPHTPDYTGELEGVVFARITDKDNTPNPGGPGAATVEDFDLRFTVPCTETASDTIGSSCSVSTTVDALLPGAVKEGRRAIWALDRVHVRDGGPDGDAGTSGNRVFLRSGVFAP